MIELDKFFLKNYVDFIHMGHLASASGMYDALVKSDETAAKVIMNLEKCPFETAIKQSKDSNDHVRVENVLIAKLFAEYIGAIEDFGALCYAISKRKEKSLFKSYADSQVEVHTYFDTVLHKEIDDLSELLSLPRLKEIELKVSESLFKDYEKSYKNCGEFIKVVAKAYKDQGNKISVSQSKDEIKAIEGDSDCIYVVLDMLENGQERRTKSILCNTYNKIKHRFLVLGSIEELLQISNKYSIQYTIIKKNPEKVYELYEKIYGTVRYSNEIAAIALSLNTYGLMDN